MRCVNTLLRSAQKSGSLPFRSIDRSGGEPVETAPVSGPTANAAVYYAVTQGPFARARESIQVPRSGLGGKSSRHGIHAIRSSGVQKNRFTRVASFSERTVLSGPGAGRLLMLMNSGRWLPASFAVLRFRHPPARLFHFSLNGRQYAIGVGTSEQSSSDDILV